MSRIAASRLLSLMVAAIFASGTVSVCLHGPDDHDGCCGQAVHDHDYAGHNETPADDRAGDYFACNTGHGDSHGDLDHHMCACASHIPVELVTTVPVGRPVGTALKRPADHGRLLAGFLAPPYRPPIA